MGRGIQKGRDGARGWRATAVAAGAALAASGAGSALAAGSAGAGQVRVGPAPPLASAPSVGLVPASAPMHVSIVLKPQDPTALAAYARAVSTPGSALYRAYLTPGQFAARFGATETEVRAVQTSMREHGLTPGQPTANRLAVPVSGTAVQVERAFSVQLRRVALAAGRRAVVPSAAPALDAAIAGNVQAVVGLTSVSAPKPLQRSGATVRGAGAASASRRRTLHAAGDGPQPCSPATATAGSDTAYTADQIASAYRLSNLYAGGAEGQGETVAVYELESYDPGDIAAYQSCYGTGAQIQNVGVDGGPADGGGPGSGEAALDIEQVVGLAPKARILVYQGPNAASNAPGSGPYDTLNAIVSQDHAQVVSISWGNCEPLQAAGLSPENSLFEEAAAQGQSVVAAAGDNGSEDCNGAAGLTPSQQDQLMVDDPGSQPFVTGVGGTTLQSPGPPPSEKVWNGPGGGGGGGGVSLAWAMPGYQASAAASLHVIGPDSSGSSCDNGAGYCRQIPDVAADADPTRGYVFRWNGTWGAAGGTSAAAPLWAALLADFNSTTACHGSPIGFANPALYHAASTSYPSYFTDVISGQNDFTGTNGGRYPAGAGYDMATGLGTPRAGALAGALCADALRVTNPGSQLSYVGQRVALRITTTGVAGGGLQFQASQLPSGLSISHSTGWIAGRPTRVGVWWAGAAALGHNLALRAAFFTWRVVGDPQLSSASLTGVASGHPRLAFMVGAGRDAPPLKTISIALSRGLSFARIGRGLTVTRPGGRPVAFSAHLVGGRLRIVLSASAYRIRVVLRAGAIRSTHRLAVQVSRRRRAVARVTVTATDSSGQGATARAWIRPRR